MGLISWLRQLQEHTGKCCWIPVIGSVPKFIVSTMQLLVAIVIVATVLPVLIVANVFWIVLLCWTPCCSKPCHQPGNLLTEGQTSWSNFLQGCFAWISAAKNLLVGGIFNIIVASWAVCTFGCCCTMVYKDAALVDCSADNNEPTWLCWFPCCIHLVCFSCDPCCCPRPTIIPQQPLQPPIVVIQNLAQPPIPIVAPAPSVHQPLAHVASCAIAPGGPMHDDPPLVDCPPSHA